MGEKKKKNKTKKVKKDKKKKASKKCMYTHSIQVLFKELYMVASLLYYIFNMNNSIFYTEMLMRKLIFVVF